MIRSLSPYYASVPWVSPATGDTSTSYTLSVYVWSGDKATPPAQPEYTFTKNNSAQSTGTDTTIDIARIISDFITPTPVAGSVSGDYDTNTAQWVKFSYTYITTVGSEPVPQGVTTKLFSIGYSYGNEGGNVETISNNKLFNVSEFKANRGSVYSVPFIKSESAATTISIVSYPDNQINKSYSKPATLESDELASNLWLNLSETTTDKYVIIKINSFEIATILIEDECKYSPVDIFFINKYGIQQSFTFFKERKESISITSSEFESDRGQPSLGNHQFKKYNVQGRSSFDAFTGFIDESNNETIQQLLLSTYVWSYDGASFTPLNVKSKSQQWRTQVNDRLINYKIDFEYSYNAINNI